MPTFNEILGTLLVVAALAMAAHEIWLYNHPHAQSYAVTPRRLRRRLLGVAVMLALVAMLTWAGHTESRRAKLALYGTSMLAVLSLFALALGDVRETSRQVIRDHLGQNPEQVAALLADPRLRALLGKMSGRELTEEEIAELESALDESRPSDRT